MHIIILGAGPAGLTLALLLHRADVSTTVYEARSPGHQTSGSQVLTANAVRILSRLGVYDSLLMLGFPHERVPIRSLDGKELKTLELGDVEKYGFPALRVLRREVQGTLVEKAETEGVDVRWGAKAVGVDAVGRGVKVRFADGTETKADYVAAADGIWSSLRKTVDPDAIPTFTGQVAVCGFTSTEALAEPGLDSTAYLGPKGMFAVLPCDSSGGVLFFSTLVMESRSRDDWEAFEADKRGLHKLMCETFKGEEWPAVVGKCLKTSQVGRYYIYAFHTALAKRYVSDSKRIILIGDAAHAIPPSAGQGGAMAMEDATTLASVLIKAQDQPHDDLSEMLVQWEEHRRERIQRVVERTLQKSNERKGTSAAQGDAKEGGIDDVDWLYGYDVREFNKILSKSHKTAVT